MAERLKDDTLAPVDYPINRKHSFVDMSTRKHFPGEHRSVLIVNGVEKAEQTFQLV